MDDKELLELAANAVGLTVHWTDESHYGPTMIIGGSPDGQDYESPWNPLNDDGDALRLAVTLEINVLPTMEIAEARNPSFTRWHAEPATADPFAATRRAIVRAAAEMGKVRLEEEGTAA